MTEHQTIRECLRCGWKVDEDGICFYERCKLNHNILPNCCFCGGKVRPPFERVCVPCQRKANPGLSGGRTVQHDYIPGEG